MAKYKRYKLSKKNWRKDFSTGYRRYNDEWCKDKNNKIIRRCLRNIVKQKIIIFLITGDDDIFVPKQKFNVIYDVYW